MTISNLPGRPIERLRVVGQGMVLEPPEIYAGAHQTERGEIQTWSRR
jgi:hypothetical protein